MAKRLAQEQLDHDNGILLAKLIKIKTQDTTRSFKPWMARSTFQYGNGTYVDPASGAQPFAL